MVNDNVHDDNIEYSNISLGSNANDNIVEVVYKRHQKLP